VRDTHDKTQNREATFLTEDRIDTILWSLEKRLKGDKPGLKAQLKMAPRPRPGHRSHDEVEESCTRAGVLALLYPWENALHLVLTRRTERLRHHQAQISFPGGRQEPGEDFVQAALRETCEELGIHPEALQVLGTLTPLYIPPSNTCIYPVVATQDQRPTFMLSPREVEEAIEVPVRHLCDPQNVHEEIWTIRGKPVRVPFYLFSGNKIWGATAMVLAELLELLE
jgi:8-oxo-dGTP pyrophosphatase MutT (NUDIX family)